MKTPEERYASDPAFHTLVHVLVGFISEHDLSMSELREAAALACNIHECRRVRPLIALEKRDG